ncbi:MAG: hypothetical protein IIY84_02635 [Eubacterium sp.]|nr:hypothetical protein [Eubacterium sp.]
MTEPEIHGNRIENESNERFRKWLNGEKDPFLGVVEMQPQEPPVDPELEFASLQEEAEAQALRQQTLQRAASRYGTGYKLMSVAVTALLMTVLLYALSFMPSFGDADAPGNNEVTERYIEKGLEETGAVNIVAGMILDYRAFDTFGESCVLFIASSAVLLLLRRDGKGKGEPERIPPDTFEPAPDQILGKLAKALVPPIMLFGIYVVLNGHLSPGGGFSGGAIIGSGLILYHAAFGERTRRFLNPKTIRVMTVGALMFYCLAKSYSFYTGANHLHSIITPGTPGALVSAGLIFYLNICVGIVVACTMYSFYALFKEGRI